MNETKLRILTRKSKLHVGAYPETTVGRLLECKKFRLLREIYYTYDSIDYQDDIKEEINLLYPIPKPGHDKSLIGLNNEMMDNRINLSKSTEAKKVISHMRKEYKITERQSKKRSILRNHYSKGRMMDDNRKGYANSVIIDWPSTSLKQGT